MNQRERERERERESCVVVIVCCLGKEKGKKMAKHSSLVIDAWIREAQEVSRLVEDIETRIRNKDLEQEYRLKDNAKSKILEVGVKLDRLESLLLNPPSNLILTIEDLEFRWKMLSDFRLRTRALAASLYPSPSIKGARGLPVANTKGIIGPDNSNDQDQMKPFFSKDDSEMLKPLISEDATQSRMQIKPSGPFTPMSILRMLCWTICLILGAATLLFLLFILCAVI